MREIVVEKRQRGSGEQAADDYVIVLRNAESGGPMDAADAARFAKSLHRELHHAGYPVTLGTES